MQRYFTKLNNNLIYGYVVINPTTGAIKINMFGMVGYNSKNEVDYKKYKEEVEFNGQQIL